MVENETLKSLYSNNNNWQVINNFGSFVYTGVCTYKPILSNLYKLILSNSNWEFQKL